MDKLVNAKSKAIIYTLITSLNESLGYADIEEDHLKQIIEDNANMAETLYKAESYSE